MKMPSVQKLNNIICFDKYEKEKLMGLFSIQKDNSVFVMDVENLIENEIIIKLKDKSCHSIMLNDKNNAYSLFLLIKDIKDGKRRFISLENLSSNVIQIITETILF
ncbi:MAG TPA: hypothetical protein VEW92_13370 [Nitrososphaeraceae archaeon]|jgi:hypothetical protein|nr:hypothetical protein [Nitrososphaeraceae archaeon]